MSRNCGCNKNRDYKTYKRTTYKNRKLPHKKTYKYKSTSGHHKRYNRHVDNKIYNAYYKRYNSYRVMSSSQLRSWDNIHKKAAEATTDEMKKEFGKYMEYLTHSFPCPKCRPHIKAYLASHPLRDYYNMYEDGKDIGMAKWSWEFHNDVNKRLSKSTVSWTDFKREYL